MATGSLAQRKPMLLYVPRRENQIRCERPGVGRAKPMAAALEGVDS